jgi:hypothetical protein
LSLPAAYQDPTFHSGPRSRHICTSTFKLPSPILKTNESYNSSFTHHQEFFIDLNQDI